LRVSETQSWDTLRPTTLVEGWSELPASTGEWAPGLHIGPFVLRERLGEGGMGVVWRAEQREPFVRDVALKIMRAGPSDVLAEAWFQIERQALAQLAHRAIAQIFDAGRLPDGSLFFAMEYVPGDALGPHIARHHPDTQALVRLMLEICRGIQHAHQRGLIHRDIKPANILVQAVEGGWQPKLIDFGIAIAADAKGAGVVSPEIAGTVAYMAPEQRQPDGRGIDIRVDVYALGVVLAECLCRLAGIAEPASGFRSTEIRAVLTDSLAARKAGGTDSARLARLPAELRAIAAKAMAERREDRYESVSALAEDLEHWLDHEPVAAMGGGTLYRLRCALRRHALASVAAGLVLLALLAGTVLALYGLAEARAGRAQAEAARLLAEQRRNDAEGLIRYMLGDFADKLRPIGRLDLLDGIGSEALRYLGGANAGSDAASALARARALRTLGEVQATRQQFPIATDTLAQADALLKPFADGGDAEHADIVFELGQIAFYRGLVEFRQRRYTETLPHWQAYLRHARAYSELSKDPLKGRLEVVYAETNLGVLADAEARFEDALEHFEHASELYRLSGMGPDGPMTMDWAEILAWIASVEGELGRPHRAARNSHEALTLVQAFGKSAPGDARQRQLEINRTFAHAQLIADLGQAEEARTHLRAALDLARADVANDPSQPRRQAMLARIAFTLARLERPQSARARVAVEIGNESLAALSADKLPKSDHLALSAASCVAGAHALGELTCIESTLASVLSSVEPGKPEFRLVDRAVELLGLLATSDPESANRQRAEVDAMLRALESRHGLKLRFLRLARLLAAIPPAEAKRLAELDVRIEALLQPENPKEIP
jgi:eukaryotic-like serine/threonine-protein kinase